MQTYRNIKLWSVFLLATNLALVSSGWFTDNVLAESSPEDMPRIVRDETDKGFAYMTGGVGIGERELMESWAQNYNLKLSFAEKSGVYLADVDIIVEDQNGKEMVSLTTNGPWLYLQLPPGIYTVKATFEGETKQIQNVRLTSGDRVTRLFHWDLEEEFPMYAAMKISQDEHTQSGK